MTVHRSNARKCTHYLCTYTRNSHKTTARKPDPAAAADAYLCLSPFACTENCNASAILWQCICDADDAGVVHFAVDVCTIRWKSLRNRPLYHISRTLRASNAVRTDISYPHVSKNVLRSSFVRFCNVYRAFDRAYRWLCFAVVDAVAAAVAAAAVAVARGSSEKIKTQTYDHVDCVCKLRM